MTPKERVLAALQGRPVDRFPVTVLYSPLYARDHFSELTGNPQWRMHEWLCSSPEGYLETFEVIRSCAPFEILQPDAAASRDVRERAEFVEKDGSGFRHDRKNGTWTRLAQTTSGHATDYAANEKQRVFDNNDVDEQVSIVRSEARIAEGCNDYREAVVDAYGQDHFILSGGVVGTFWRCHQYVGLTNLFAMIVQRPDLIEYLSQKLLEDNIEVIRTLAAAGGDAIFIDDATTTCDMISVEHYERFSLPYVKEMVREIHRLGRQAILIYFGGIADRMDQIASIGADGLSMEASMKGYVNDIDLICRTIGDRVTPFGNIDPVGVLQQGTDEQVESEVRRQIAAGTHARGFVVCTGSPITPATRLPRVQRFIELGRKCQPARESPA